MYISGHYEFEILIKSIHNIQKTIFRRYSDLEILHDGLIKYNPGCKIPTIPEKSIWCNFYVQNYAALGKRKRSIEEYLSYVHNHKHLSQNPIYLIFISDNFDNFKSEQIKKFSWMDKLVYVKDLIPKILIGVNNNKKKENEYSFDNEKENLMRLEKGINEITKILERYMAINDVRSESLKNIFNITKSLENKCLKFDENADNKVNKNIETFFNLYDKTKIYSNSSLTIVKNQLKKYTIDVNELKEIFLRKEKIENILYEMKGGRVEEDISEKNEMEKILIQLCTELKEEIELFKNKREKALIEILKKFFKDKYELNVDIKNLYNVSSLVVNC